MINKRLFGLPALSAAALLAAVASSPVQAGTVTFNYDVVFSAGSVAPDGPAPYLTATFDDGNTPGSVNLAMTISADVGGADVDDLYFNFDPSLDLNALTFLYDGSSTGPAAAGGGNNGIFVGSDAFQADGDGLFDINFNFPPPPGNVRWMAGQTVIYDITSTDAITAQSFQFFSAPAGGAGGPFLSAAHFLSTGPTEGDSAWVGAVPVPAAVWLFGSGLVGLVGVARRRRS